MRIRVTGPILAIVLGVAPAGAAPITWNLTSSACTTTGGSSDGNTRTCVSAGTPVTASAWANTLGSANTGIEDARLEVFSGGLGVNNRDRSTGDTNEGVSPEHAVDNNDRYDSILFDFGAGNSIDLDSLSIGWVGSDSDITVLAYTGAGVPPLAGVGYASLVGSGWSLVGQYGDAGTGTEVINPTNIASRYWLVGAYNPLVGGTTYTSGNDAVKLQYLTGERRVVPEPTDLALLGMGLLVVARRLRRSTPVQASL